MRVTLIIAAGIVLALAAACGGGGSRVTLPTNNASAITGSVDGYLTQTPSGDMQVSAAGTPVHGAEVWCEDANGLRIGQDTTDSDGHYALDGLPIGRTLTFRYRYQYQYQTGEGSCEIEGEMGLILRTRERLRVDAELQLRDGDGDGVPDEALCSQNRMQVRLRRNTSAFNGEGADGDPPEEAQGDKNRDENGDCSGQCPRDRDSDEKESSAYNGEGADGDPPGDAQGDKNRDENGECDGKCPRDRDSDD